MNEEDYVGTLDVQGKARVRLYCPSSRNLDWLTDLNEAKQKGYSIIEGGTTLWIIYGKDLRKIDDVIRGALEISLNDIPENAELGVVSGEYRIPSSASVSLQDESLGNVIINSTFMTKQLSIPKNLVLPKKVIPNLTPKVIPKPLDSKAEHLANQRKMTFWERTKAAVNNRPSNK